MTCPYCDEELRYGVKVCRGCQAEISYEPEPTGFLMFIIGCGLIYYHFKGFFPYTIVPLIIGIVTLLIGIFQFYLKITGKRGPAKPIFRRQFRYFCRMHKLKYFEI